MGARGTRTKPPRLLRAAAIGATVAALATGGWTVASAEPVVPVLPEIPTPGHTYVTPDDPHGFTDTETKAPGTVTIDDSLSAPPSGNADALVLKTPDGDAKARFFTPELAGPLSNFLSSSYYAQRSASSTGSDIQFPSFQIPVDKNGGTFEQGDFSTLTFEPIYQSGTNADTTPGWHKYDTGSGVFCSTQPIKGFEGKTRCAGTRTLAEIIDDNPGITALSAGINQGSGNPGIVGGVDLIQVGSTTYNFERKAPLPPVVPEEPMEPEDPACDAKPEHPGPGMGMPGGGQSGHPHPGGGGHPDGMQGGGGSEDPKSEDPKSHPKPEHPKGEHPGGGQPSGEHPEEPHGGGHPDGPKPPTCES